MIRTQAQELLDDPRHVGRLGMEELESLMLRAGYKYEDAHRTAMNRGFNRLAAGETA